MRRIAYDMSLRMGLQRLFQRRKILKIGESHGMLRTTVYISECTTLLINLGELIFVGRTKSHVIHKPLIRQHDTNAQRQPNPVLNQ